MLRVVKRWSARALRSRPRLRAGALRAGSLIHSLERSRPGVYTLCYHHVAAESQDRFSAQIGLLRQFGAFIDADTAVRRIQTGGGRRDRAFLLTFDDGYADTVDVALPVIKAHAIPAIVFLVSDWLEAPPTPSGGRIAGYMSRADVDTWLAAGLSIGSHSASHRRFSALGDDEAEAEFRRSAEVLGRLNGAPVQHFACPWGVAHADYVPARDPVLAQAAGYATFFTTRRGRACETGDLMAMPRHVLEPEWDLYQLRTLLGGSRFAIA